MPGLSKVSTARSKILSQRRQRPDIVFLGHQKPSIVSFPEGSSHLFFRGIDNHVCELSSTSTSDWLPTTDPVRVIHSDEPDIISARGITVYGVIPSGEDTLREVDVFVHGADNIVYHKMYEVGPATNWEVLGGVWALSDVAVAGRNTNMYAAVRTNDDWVAFKERRGGAFRRGYSQVAGHHPPD
ncbi:hypothetical protein ACHAPT_009476 [Fusarium lateritium]